MRGMAESDRAPGLSSNPSFGLHALRPVLKPFVRIVFMPFAVDYILKPFRKCRFGQEILNCFLNFLKKSDTNF